MQVLKQGGVSRIEFRKERLLKRVEVIAVSVPIEPAFSHGHKTHSGLDQPACEQTTLPHGSAAVLVANRFRLLFDVESLLRTRRIHQVVSARVIIINGRGLVTSVN